MTLLATNHPTYLRRLVRAVTACNRAYASAYVRGATRAYRVARVAYLVDSDTLRVRLIDGDTMFLNGSDAAERFFDGRDGSAITASREA